MVAATVVFSACSRAENHVVPRQQAAAYDTAARVPTTFTFTIPKRNSGTQRQAHYLSPGTRSITLLLTDVKNHGDSSDMFASIPAAFKTTQIANVTDTTSNPDTQGNCGTDPNNSANVKCTEVFLLPIGDDYVTLSSWDAPDGSGNLLSQFVATAPLYVQPGLANAFAVAFDAQVGAATNCPNPTIVMINLPGSGASGSQCDGNSPGTFFVSGTGFINWPVTFKDATGNVIDPTVPGAPILTAGYESGGTLFFSKNPYSVGFRGDGLPGFTRIHVHSNGLHFATDNITEREFAVGIQKDAQAGSDVCPSPSIIVTPPNSGVTGTECSGSDPGTFTITGAGPFAFPVTIIDVNGNSVAGGSVGAPVLAASGGGAIASVTTSQNPFQLTVTPTGASGSAVVTVTVTSAHPGDGVVDRSISFTVTGP